MTLKWLLTDVKTATRIKGNLSSCFLFLKWTNIQNWTLQIQRLPPAYLLPESFWGRPLDRQFGIICGLCVRLGQAKIADLGHNVIRDQHITSCQVPVNQLLGLQVLHPFTHVTKRNTHTSTCHTDRGVAMTLHLSLKEVKKPTGQSAAVGVQGGANGPWSWES